MNDQFDTSGAISWVVRHPEPGQRYAVTWSDLSPFTQGCVEALFASARFDSTHARDCEYVTSDGPAGCTCPAGRFGYRRPLRFDWLAPETLERIVEDCERFRRPRTSSKSAAVGALFWKNRAGNYLSDDGWMPLTPYLGDDGKVYLREGA